MVWYYVDAIAYFVFILIVLAEAVVMDFSVASMSHLQWLTLVYVLAFIHNEIRTFRRESFRFYFSHQGHETHAVLFVVFFVLRFIGIYGDTDSASTIFRVSSYIVGAAATMACTRLYQYLRTHSRFGPIQRSFSKMQNETFFFLSILVIYFLAFATAMTHIYGATKFAVNETAAGAEDNCPAQSFDG